MLQMVTKVEPELRLRVVSRLRSTDALGLADQQVQYVQEVNFYIKLGKTVQTKGSRKKNPPLMARPLRGG